MGMKTFYYILIAVSVIFILFGLLFLIAAMQNPARMHVAMLSGFIGFAMAYFSFAAISRINYNSPQNLEPLILKIAKKSGGYFSAEEIMAKLGVTEKVFTAALDHMLSKGSVMSGEDRDGTMVYKTAAVSLEVKRKCEFCGAEYNVRDSITSCPGCGGNVKMG